MRLHHHFLGFVWSNIGGAAAYVLYARGIRINVLFLDLPLLDHSDIGALYECQLV